jgi:hypothetical protein
MKLWSAGELQRNTGGFFENWWGLLIFELEIPWTRSTGRGPRPSARSTVDQRWRAHRSIASDRSRAWELTGRGGKGTWEHYSGEVAAGTELVGVSARAWREEEESNGGCGAEWPGGARLL